jgi:DNA modification methylase
VNKLKQNYKTEVPKAELAQSAKTREELLVKWSYEPLSMMWLNKIHDHSLDVLIEDTLAQGSYISNNYNIRDGALAQTPAIVIERFLKFYTNPGDTVLNPMMERCGHLLIAHKLKRNVVGQDICERFYWHDVEKVKRRILSAQTLDSENNKIVLEDENHFHAIYNGLRFDLNKGDSRKLDLPDESIDHITTSPPYWDLGIYGDEPEQVGSGTGTGKGDTPTYEEFLEALGEVYKECFRVLKKGKYFCVQVNDFRKNGKFYNYHNSVIQLLESIGFTYHDLIIYNISVHPLAAVFTSQLSDRMVHAKCHEYAIIVKKDA